MTPQPLPVPDRPGWEAAIRGARARSAVGDISAVVAEIGVQVVAAIRDSYEVPTPGELLEVLLPASPDEITRLAARNPAQADWLLGLAAIRKGMEK